MRWFHFHALNLILPEKCKELVYTNVTPHADEPFELHPSCTWTHVYVITIKNWQESHTLLMDFPTVKYTVLLAKFWALTWLSNQATAKPAVTTTIIIFHDIFLLPKLTASKPNNMINQSNCQQLSSQHRIDSHNNDFDEESMQSGHKILQHLHS